MRWDILYKTYDALMKRQNEYSEQLETMPEHLKRMHQPCFIYYDKQVFGPLVFDVATDKKFHDEGNLFFSRLEADVKCLQERVRELEQFYRRIQHKIK